ncbi:NAD(+)/NADH kinase [Microbacterium sp. EYE_5]|uniref:diacylglycerol/lipid kinase family protein n=1 Tax=unclassified Microbacterium TaxID=2609290 RepID=UPI0020038D74|nr:MULTISPECIES: diacylglycerol kinase family protein [unclassified Microbacterium]MCK6081265.1 NAD(+)/NADH kinase [Microbacterium sp. EYE_382]MCK6086535.1 NAD(+)/NADH kinase [Microbacterium sp. EYE_384]MCK6123967.1 NAD(+)/NADH kinase [Microbacterium sp. EYE_80]MCK6126876.1 NAD(+)/NADH kinase [Microbacterium sp. EYE_79]MCK6142220.1 NAD(+)/NADH kinase [Microbacterium sp. EYE_39]
MSTGEHRSTPPHAAIVYHPGKAPVERIGSAVREQETSRSWRPSRWYETDPADAGIAAVEQALRDGPAVVIVAGGDGTVRVATEIMAGSGIPLALVPAGTGNLLARDLGVSLTDVEASVAAAFSGRERRIDVGRVDLEEEGGARRSHAFVVMAGIGLDADMAAGTNAVAKRHLGWFAYVAPIARSVLANRLFHLHYRVNGGRRKSARAHTVIVGNCGTLAGNLLLLPHAVVDDGLLDVVMMRPKGRFGWAGIGSRLTAQGVARTSRLTRRWMARAPELHALAYAQGRRFEARFDVPHLIQLDGDPFGQVVGVRIAVEPGALRVAQPDALN